MNLTAPAVEEDTDSDLTCQGASEQLQVEMRRHSLHDKVVLGKVGAKPTSDAKRRKRCSKASPSEHDRFCNAQV
jgi:hypothetical protein